MISVQTSHTADLEPATLSAARALLYDVFDDMDEHDWEHSLGGVHAIAWDGDDARRPRRRRAAAPAARRARAARRLHRGGRRARRTTAATASPPR